MKHLYLFIFAYIFSVNGSTIKKFWYDGNAEISSYAIKENRYGELREGTRVMVFVTEPLRISTLVKPDESLPSNEKIDVIKLNDMVKFNTGIYDYSVMTSIFSSVDYNHKSIPYLGTIKVVLTAQEWCGTVFNSLKRKNNTFAGHLVSYFDSEREKRYSLPIKERTETEENLWILCRELEGHWISVGGEKNINIIPSLWESRKEHKPQDVYHCTITKEDGGSLRTSLGYEKSHRFTWTYNSKKTTVWVEQKYPHRILKWKKHDGSEGVLLKSIRKPYWELHDNKHLFLRKTLKLEN